MRENLEFRYQLESIGQTSKEGASELLISVKSNIRGGSGCYGYLYLFSHLKDSS